MKKILIILFSFALWASVYAGSSGEKDILRVEVTDSFFAIYSANGPIGSEGCEDQLKVIFWREDFPNGYDSLLSTALAAHISNKQVSMWLAGCKAGPWGKTLPKAVTLVVL